MSDEQQAFPDLYRNGMTLRDYFAAQAMQALIGRTDFDFDDDPWKTAYLMADAMLKAREEE
jgi:hypothetical protein